jgi:hypothetical protein
MLSNRVIGWAALVLIIIAVGLLIVFGNDSEFLDRSRSGQFVAAYDVEWARFMTMRDRNARTV